MYCIFPLVFLWRNRFSSGSPTAQRSPKIYSNILQLVEQESVNMDNLMIHDKNFKRLLELMPS